MVGRPDNVRHFQHAYRDRRVAHWPVFQLILGGDVSSLFCVVLCFVFELCAFVCVFLFVCVCGFYERVCKIKGYESSLLFNYQIKWDVRCLSAALDQQIKVLTSLSCGSNTRA